MARPALEVADVFRDFGPAWRQSNAGHVSLGQLKVMSAIERCRTAALGGHVARCEDCAYTTIAYNSCIMGRSSNGELAYRCLYFSVNCGSPCLHNVRSRGPIGLATDGRSQTGTNVLETYFPAARMLGHLRSGPSGPYLDGFAAALERQGYSPATAVRYLRAAAHVGHVMAEQGASSDDIDLAAFSEHLRICRCPRAKGGRRNHHTVYGARLFRRHLVEIGMCRPAVATAPAEPHLVARFKAWLCKHRGASDPTIKLYARDAAHLMTALGTDPSGWDPADVRNYFMDRASHCGNGTVEKLTTSLRAFLRYLAVEGCCQAGLDNVVPSVTGLRISEALNLTVADVTNDGLLIRETKFRKTRLVPLHDTAAAGLKRYLARRQPRSADDPVFVDERGLALRYLTVRDTFNRLVSTAGIRPAAARRPRLHDLRHTFAVRALQGSPAGRSRCGPHMAALATYMGHVNIYATYWYLEATADLMRDVAAAGEGFISAGRQS